MGDAILDMRNTPQAAALMGGKGSSLYELARGGQPVPAWFCVSARVCAERLAPLAERAGALLARLDPARPQGVRTASAELLETSAALPLAGEDRRAIEEALGDLDGERFAVRSSAVGEDGSADSFAGQLETYLHVRREDVVERVTDCQASAFTARALAYGRERGRTPGPVAVVVQEMVASRSAGVLFTANPAGSLDELVVVAAWGLGEGVVGDLVESDTYVYDRLTRAWSRSVGSKRSRVVLDEETGTGTCVRPLPESLREGPVLDDDQLEALRTAAEAIEALCGPGQDVEWAFDERGRLAITQSRPITTLPRGELSIFDASNIVESYPGITSPLTFSYILAAYARVFRDMARRLGVPRRELEHNDDLFESMLGHLDGRVYYNLGSWYRLFLLVPFTGSYLGVWEEMLGIRNPRPASARARRSAVLRDLPRAARAAGSFTWNLLRLTPRMERLRRRFAGIERRFRRTDLDELDTVALARLYRSLSLELMDGWDLTLLNDAYAIIGSGLVRAQLERAGAEADAFGALMAGEEDLESARPAHSLALLADAARGDEALLEALAAAAEAEDAAVARAFPDHPDFARRFEEHLERWGDRHLAELKLESPSLRRHPRLLAGLILRQARGGHDAAQAAAHRKRLRERARAECARAFAGAPHRRALFAVALRLARRSVRYRESSRMDRARGFGMMREVFWAMAERLVAEGALEAADDVFLLTVDELLGFATGSGVDAELRAIVERRRAEAAARPDGGPARERLRFRGTVGAHPSATGVASRTQPADAPAPGDAGTLEGTGCSAGTVTAEAVVVRDPSQAADTAGKVLVAEMTDPGWVFLMMSAAGLVVERGSLLSHTAIIGRELGVPTVVGVPGACSLIGDGDRVELDGRSGRVHVFARARDEEAEG
ncbi:MAG: PEP/pyruvate-binding domain-containing protein [Planctomycetota bacterium]|nr:PEP/pyruvate-binding domain-containing protein [Planctomycetota bacterium]